MEKPYIPALLQGVAVENDLLCDSQPSNCKSLFLQTKTNLVEVIISSNTQQMLVCSILFAFMEAFKFTRGDKDNTEKQATETHDCPLLQVDPNLQRKVEQTPNAAFWQEASLFNDCVTQPQQVTEQEINTLVST